MASRRARRGGRRNRGAAGRNVELGSTGIVIRSGLVSDEWLAPLRSQKQRHIVFREMRDNDPIVGAILFMIEMLIRRLEWSCTPRAGFEEDATAVELAEFVHGALNDMSQTWESTLSDIVSMLWHGFSVHELVYKTRRGMNTTDGSRRSKFEDGRIGWRKIAIRGQETIRKWHIDDEGGLEGIEQWIPQLGKHVDIPIEKLALFRTTSNRGNPEGRALSPDTAIPTPDGWRALDALDVGDKVFDEAGRIRYVTGRQDWENRPRYVVRFGDGTEIIADENHQWMTTLVWERAKRLTGRVRTTAEISRTVKNSNGVSNHAIAWAGALDYPEQALPVDPYYFGLWLGDGSSRGAQLYAHADDVDELCEHIEAATGFECEGQPNGTQGGLGRVIQVRGSRRWAPDNPARRLRDLGVIENKHIPPSYMRSSIEQRRALLAGLMDSDGHVDADGRCEFTNTRADLSLATAELVRSLGIGARVTTKLNSHGNTAWLVKFTPDFSPFRLARKATRCKLARARKHHYITEIVQVDNGRTVCIEVDSPSHLFLAGESMVPTHNSVLRNAYRPWYFKKRIEEIEGIGIERDLAGLPVLYVPAKILNRNATGEDRAMRIEAEKIVTGVRRDEQEGVLMPSELYPETDKRLYSLELLTTGGTRQFDTNSVITRYDTRIAMTVLADFLMLGHTRVGTQTTSSDKREVFAMALNTFTGEIASVFDEHIIPRLMRLNGLMDSDVYPQLLPELIEDTDLGELGDYVQKLSGAGAALFPDENVENMLRQVAGIPLAGDEETV